MAWPGHESYYHVWVDCAVIYVIMATTITGTKKKEGKAD
jgi:hypothetical protein